MINAVLTSHDIAKMIDHSLLSPALTDRELEEECAIAAKYDVAAVCVKPYHVAQSKKLLQGTDVLVAAVVAFPAGNSTTEMKAAETRQVLGDGADEVDMVVNIGKVLEEKWDYVEADIAAVVNLTKGAGAALKVIFENDLLSDDKYKIKLCEICSALQVDFVKTSTGYNFNKVGDNLWSYDGATDHDLALMRQHSAPQVQVKAAGCVGDLETILRVHDNYGVTRVGTKRTIEILAEAKKKFGE